MISPVAGVVTGGVTPAPVRFDSNERPNEGVGLGEPVGVPVGVGVGVLSIDPNVPLRIVAAPLRTEIVEPEATTGTVWPLSLRSRRRPSPPLWSEIVPAEMPLTITVSEVPIARLIWRTRTSSSVRLLCNSYEAKPVGSTPFNVGPVSPANRSPAFGVADGEGDGDGLPVGEPVGDGEPVGEPVGETDGDGLPVGEPVGDVVGVGVAPPPNTPATSTVAPFRT